jgi:hypothetical protein
MDATDRCVTAMAALALLCGGCSAGGPGREITAESAGAATVSNGTFFNGTFFNGIFFNGVQLEPLRLDAIRLGGHVLPQVSLVGASLVAQGPGGSVVSGSGLVGAELSGSLSNGQAVTLRIDGVTAGTDADIQRYTVSARVNAAGGFQPLCGAAADGTPVLALPLSGSWDASAGTLTGGAHVDDPDVFTFACEGYVLAKCVEFGYAPWRSVTECDAPGTCATRSLAPFHQACTRLLRADYCGDGTATTRDGTPVDIWDRFGLQTDDAPTWTFEAEWGEGGAVCVDATRWATVTSGGEDVETYIQDHCADRWQAAGCGGDGSTFFTANGYDVPLATRALLRSRITPHG